MQVRRMGAYSKDLKLNLQSLPKGALCPALEPGQIVVMDNMDNLSVHKGKAVRELIE